MNPAQIHAFGKGVLGRAKTDEADAKCIARYALQASLEPWVLLPVNIQHLQALTRRLEHLLETQQMEKNRLDKANGKNNKPIACVTMRKLIQLAFAVLKSGKPFDPNFSLA